ncbi:nucleotidyltransferase family protein [Veillonella sp. VA139]|uniref:tRNA(Met) cytidine acetate ligase n=1 Tax=Veillonella sp. VA139 TaxID=741830 RepID=UPI000F8DBAFD|nr:nucleotidyltransferase family protein [Veillonella sp. VA139]
MNTIGIIAEYNPFHKGHAHQLQELRRAYPDATLLIVMSGDFVQRGTPAIFSKFHRAQWAIMGGADIVFELPSMFAVSSAEYFASGGVRLLHALGCDAISFGASHTDVEELVSIAKVLDHPSTQESLRTLLGQGYSYSTALRKAIQLYHSTNTSLNTDNSFGQNSESNIISETKQPSSGNNSLEKSNHMSMLNTDPNIILGIEYIRALHRYHIELDIIPVKRTSSHHNPTLGDSFPSGTALRNAIYASKPTSSSLSRSHNILQMSDTSYAPCASLEDDASRLLDKLAIDSTASLGTHVSNWYHYFPPMVAPLAMDIVESNYYATLERYYDMIHLTSRVATKEDLQTLHDMSDGLEDAWLTASTLSSWEQARESLKSKRYTYARLDRLATYSLFRRTQEMFQDCHQQGPTYGRLLAFNDRGRQYLKGKRSSIPIVQKWAPFCQQATGITKVLCEQDQLASRLWRLTIDNPRYRDSHYDYTTSPMYVQSL